MLKSTASANATMVTAQRAEVDENHRPAAAPSGSRPSGRPGHGHGMRFHACENRLVSERMKVWISRGVIIASVTLFLWWPFGSMRVVDGMPDGGPDPGWPIWLGLAGIAAGTALLLFWGRGRPSRRSDPAED